MYIAKIKWVTHNQNMSIDVTLDFTYLSYGGIIYATSYPNITKVVIVTFHTIHQTMLSYTLQASIKALVSS